MSFDRATGKIEYTWKAPAYAEGDVVNAKKRGKNRKDEDVKIEHICTYYDGNLDAWHLYTVHFSDRKRQECITESDVNHLVSRGEAWFF